LTVPTQQGAIVFRLSDARRAELHKAATGPYAQDWWAPALRDALAALESTERMLEHVGMKLSTSNREMTDACVARVKQTVTLVIDFLRARSKMTTPQGHAALALWTAADYIEHQWLGVPWEQIKSNTTLGIAVKKERDDLRADERKAVAATLRALVAGRTTEHDAGVRYAASLIDRMTSHGTLPDA